MNQERKLFWAAMVVILGGTCFIARERFAGQRDKSFPATGPAAQIESSPAGEKQVGPPEGARPPVLETSAAISISAAPVAPAPADESERFLRKFDPKLMENPGMEDLIRNRLWLALDQLNNPLVKKMGLTADETEKFKGLIVDNLVVAVEQAGASSEQGPAAVETAWDNALAARQQDFAVRLRQLLGDARFAQYEAGREDYSQFNGIKFLDGSSTPMADGRVEQIISVMQDERRIVDGAVAEAQAGSAAPLSPEERFQVRELVVARVCDRLYNLLLPEQLAGFGRFQAQQLDGFRARTVRDAAGNSSPGE
jgi:hypothetical protein